MKFKIIALFCVVLALCTAIFFLPNVKQSSDGSRQYIFISKEAHTDDVVDSILKQDAFRFKYSLALAVRCVSVFRPIQYGCYELTDGVSTARFINRIIKGQESPIKISFNNIRTKEQLATVLGRQLMLSKEKILHALNDSAYLLTYGVTPATAVCLFIPDTYEVYWTSSVDALFFKMNHAYNAFWNAERTALAKQIPLSKEEVITLASIVEEESSWEKEQPTIAGLYLNRLRIGMRLQADPTIKFAVGDFSLKRILKKHIELSKESAYNTYTHLGLPPGPIRIPSKRTVDAVLHYEKHKFLYMCAKGTNERGHNFTTNFSQHRQNAVRYQKNMNRLGIK